MSKRNAFGEPMQGSKIMGVGALARARGHAFSRLSSQQRSMYGNQSRYEAAADNFRSTQQPAAAAPKPDALTPATDEAQEKAKEALREQGRKEVLGSRVPSSRFEGKAPAGQLEVYESGRSTKKTPAPVDLEKAIREGRVGGGVKPSSASGNVTDFNWTPEQMAKARRTAGGIGAKYTATGRPKTW